MPLCLNERETRTWVPGEGWFYALVLCINGKLCHTITYCLKTLKSHVP